ncbi:MAG: SymE family type I addiction module toxin [Bacteroidota bacterium]
MKTRLVTVCSLLSNGGKVPQLRLSGRWLAKLGFHPGAKVAVEEEAGRLTLRIASGNGVSPCE